MKLIQQAYHLFAEFGNISFSLTKSNCTISQGQAIIVGLILISVCSLLVPLEHSQLNIPPPVLTQSSIVLVLSVFLTKTVIFFSLISQILFFQAIHGYRETERLKWREENLKIINRVRESAFLPGSPQMHYVHILDLAEDGYIKAHIDSVKVC